jgi:hypothetical protein
MQFTHNFKIHACVWDVEQEILKNKRRDHLEMRSVMILGYFVSEKLNSLL